VEGTGVNAFDDRLRYGGPCFVAASELPLEGGLLSSASLRAFLAAARERPWRIASLILLLVRTQVEYLSVSDSMAGRALRTHFGARALRLLPQNRFCQGVLILPGAHSEYLRGRRRQAVRTNVRQAAAAGIQCELVTDQQRALDAAQAVLDARRIPISEADARWWRSRVSAPELTYLVARDSSGRPLAFAAAAIDRSACLIRFGVASDHHARWALHDYIVQVLIERGVRYLLVDYGGPFGALGLARGTQHFQHLLGYELRHVVARAA
jgi:hypothetical protein